MGSGNLPGSVIDLIRLTANRASKGGSAQVEARDVIATLSQLIGLPIGILDNQERIDLGEIRAYFCARVIGQNEAVSAIVERIAMLKAGLNDPGKPIGVLLFAGSTVPARQSWPRRRRSTVRIDRSPHSSRYERVPGAEAIAKILGDGGAGGETNSLIARVRKQPFSVVLLDEFEKAHPNIWDLFLQVFDDGRLTDTLGHVADFRHCMIILTTNLGATSHREPRPRLLPRPATASPTSRCCAPSARPSGRNSRTGSTR